MVKSHRFGFKCTLKMVKKNVITKMKLLKMTVVHVWFKAVNEIKDVFGRTWMFEDILPRISSAYSDWNCGNHQTQDFVNVVEVVELVYNNNHASILQLLRLFKDSRFIQSYECMQQSYNHQLSKVKIVRKKNSVKN